MITEIIMYAAYNEISEAVFTIPFIKNKDLVIWELHDPKCSIYGIVEICLNGSRHLEWEFFTVEPGTKYRTYWPGLSFATLQEAKEYYTRDA